MQHQTNGNRFDLWLELVKTSFVLKYNNSLLGFVWILLRPFMQFLILYLVFSNFSSNKEVENFILYLLIGILLFSFIQESITTGINALLDKSGIILKVNFDKTLAIYSSLTLSLINLVINSSIFVVFAIPRSVGANPVSILYFVFMLFIAIVALCGLAFFLSIITVKLRDLQPISEVILQLLFYLTPILYNIDIMPERFQSIIRYNPIYIFIQASRNAVIYGDITLVQEVAVIAVLSILLFISGYIFFNKKIVYIAEYF